MDIIGYVFLGLAVISLIAGLAKGFTNTLFGLLTAVGSIAVAVILTPTVSKLDFVENLVEDTPIIINGTAVFFLRTVIVFCVLFVLGLIVFLSLKGLFSAILKRVNLLKVLDKLLGAVVNVAVVWMIFGILFTLSSAGADWLIAIDQQLAESGIELGLANIAGEVFTHFTNSQILQTVYSTFNPIGDLVGGMLL